MRVSRCEGGLPLVTGRPHLSLLLLLSHLGLLKLLELHAHLLPVFHEVSHVHVLPFADDRGRPSPLIANAPRLEDLLRGLVAFERCETRLFE